MLWVGSTSTRGGTPSFVEPCFAARVALDTLAVSFSTELSCFGIVVPGTFTSGTNQFANAGQPDSKDVEDAYFGKHAKYYGMSGTIFTILAALEREDANVEEVAREIVRLVGMKHGEKPFRVHIDPSDDGATLINGVADLAREDFCRRFHQEELLNPAWSIKV